MKKIRIKATPPGFAKETIRKDWVGCEIPLATKDEIDIDPPSNLTSGTENKDGYLVLREKAILALREKGKYQSANFWESLLLGRYLLFKKDVCEVIQ